MMALVAAGCVVPDPPEYGVARQTPPFLNLLSASGVFELREYKEGDQESVSVDVRSEDAGDSLFAQLFLNYNVANEQLLGVAVVPPSTFDDTTRQILITFNVPKRLGCQQMALVVTHVGNLTPTNKPNDPKDAGIATWWVSIDDDKGTADSTLLSECPRQGVNQ